MINERTALTNALEKAGANDAQIGAAVGNHLNELVERHYPGNAAKQADAFTKYAANEARGAELAKALVTIPVAAQAMPLSFSPEQLSQIKQAMAETK